MEKQYTLTFDANGGTVSETSRTITEGNQIEICQHQIKTDIVSMVGML